MVYRFELCLGKLVAFIDCLIDRLYNYDNTMTPIDYVTLLNAAFKDYATLITERGELDLKLAQREQFIRATVNMLPEDERPGWEFALDALGGESVGLSQAIRNVLQSAPQEFHTATEVRKALERINFNFEGYTTNPLASVHAALKRLKPDEAKMEKIDGVMAWRWVGPSPSTIPPVIPGTLAKAFEAMYGVRSPVSRPIRAHRHRRKVLPTRPQVPTEPNRK